MGWGKNATIKVFWNKYYQLLSTMQIQQSAIKGIFNASLFSLSGYCSASATYSQREWRVPSLPASAESRERRMLYQPSRARQDGILGFKSHPHPDLSQAPAGIYFCWAHQLGGSASYPLFLKRKPSQSLILLKIILHATFAWGANLSSCHTPAPQLRQILI